MSRNCIVRILVMVLCIVAMTCILNYAMAWADEICINCGSETGNGTYIDCGELHQYVCFDCNYAHEPVPHAVDCECHEWKYEPNGASCRAYCVQCGQKGHEQQHVVLCHVDLTHCTHCSADVGSLPKAEYEQIHLYINRDCVCGDIGDIVEKHTSSGADFEYTKKKQRRTDSWQYEEVAIITKYTGSDSFVVIPDMIDGYRVTGIGNGWHLAFNSGVEYVIIPPSVSYIDDYAFRGNTTLKSIALPDGCSHGHSVFSGCSALTQVYLPNGSNGDTAFLFNRCSSLKYVHIPASWTELAEEFRGCTSLENITIPESVYKISKDAFKGCTSLKTVTIPNSVTTITGNPFTGCTSLTDIRVAENHPTLEVVDGVLFDKVSKTLITYPCSFDAEYYEVPEGTTAIAGGAFHAGHSTRDAGYWVASYNINDRLVEVHLPNTVVEIGNDAFWGRHALQRINIPEGVTVIQEETFAQCVSLERIVLPDSVEKIGSRAFAYCFGLKDVEYPAKLEYIGNQAFAHCISLTRIEIPYGMTVLGDQYAGCHSIIEAEIPESVTVISGAFQGWYNIKEIVIPNSVQELHTYAFSACTSLKELYLPESITRIEQWAILDNPVLEMLFIPDSVVEIEKDAIKGCNILTIYCVEGSAAWQYAKDNNIPVQVVDAGENTSDAENNPIATATPQTANTTNPPSSTSTINLKLQANRGQYTISWDKKVSEPYQISIQLNSCDKIVYGDSKLYGNSYTTDSLLPGRAYTVTITESGFLGREGESFSGVINVPRTNPFWDEGISAGDIEVQISPRFDADGHGDKRPVYLQSFKNGEMARKITYYDWHYGLYYKINFPNFEGDRTYLLTLAFRAPNGYQWIEYSGHVEGWFGGVEFSKSSSCWKWNIVGHGFFEALLYDYGEIPSGRYYVDLYWDGMLVNSTPFEVY